MTKEEIGNILKELRLKNGMTQKEVASKIGRNQPIIGHWETGYSQPDANTLFTLCEIYGVSIDEAFGFTKKEKNVSLKEYEHIKKYRALDPIGRQHVDTVLTWETERVFHQNLYLENEKRDDEVPVYILNYYQRLASAGSGEYLFDNIPTDTIEVPITSTSEQADFVIGVNGHSMEPTYYDGDKVYVKITDEIPIGSIGVFTRGNECFIKELGVNCLKSHSKGYEDIPANNDIRLVGEVLGKLEED